MFRAAQTHLVSRVGLGFKQQQAERQVSQTTAAAIGQHADIPQPVDAVLIPDPAGGRGNAVLKDQRVPAFRVQRISPSAEHGPADGKQGGDILARGKPLTLNHTETS